MSASVPPGELLAELDTATVADNHYATDQKYKAVTQRLYNWYANEAGLLNEFDVFDRNTADDRMLPFLLDRQVKAVAIQPGDPDDRRSPDTSVSVKELTDVVFTHGPSEQQCLEGDSIWQSLGKKVRKTILTSAMDSHRGRLQSRLKAHGLVLVHGIVFRDDHPVEGIYCTAHGETILHEFWGPRAEELTKIGRAWEQDKAMNAERLPAETMAAIEGYLGGEIRKLIGRLGLTPAQLGLGGNGNAGSLGSGK